MGISAGVAGTGRLGRQHVRVLRELDGVDFVGCHDTDAERAAAVAGEFGAAAFSSLDEMLERVDAVSIVVPTTHHADVALRAIAAGCDVFVEKPIAHGVREAENIVSAAARADRILQVGHVERFNGALEAVLPRIESPSFIEIHRLAPFSIRGTDVSVVGDLMIHDLDLLGCIVKERPVEIRAKGAALLTRAPDIVNARLEYPGGCVANVTASRVTASPMRKIRVFSDSGYVSVDMLAGKAVMYRKSDRFDSNIDALRAGAGDLNLLDFIEVEQAQSDGEEPLKKELGAFCRCVVSRERPTVTGEDGLEAVRLAQAILDAMKGA